MPQEPRLCLILEGSNRESGLLGGFQNSFIWRTALWKWNALWKPDLENRSKRSLKKPENWLETPHYCNAFCFLCVSSSDASPYRLPDSASIILIEELIGPTSPQWSVSGWTSFSTAGDYRHGTNSSWVIRLFIPGHPGQRGPGENKWVHKTALGLQGEGVGKAVPFRMGKWTEHPPRLTCPGQALSWSSVSAELEEVFNGVWNCLNSSKDVKEKLSGMNIWPLHAVHLQRSLLSLWIWVFKRS